MYKSNRFVHAHCKLQSVHEDAGLHSKAGLHREQEEARRGSHDTSARQYRLPRAVLWWVEGLVVVVAESDVCVVVTVVIPTYIEK